MTSSSALASSHIFPQIHGFAHWSVAKVPIRESAATSELAAVLLNGGGAAAVEAVKAKFGVPLKLFTSMKIEL